MKLIDLLLESPTDTVARFYKEASEETDRFYNPEDVKYKKQNTNYYDQYFKEWFDNGIVPVFTKPVNKPQPEYTNKPKDGKLQSPGFRGLQYALCASDLPYDNKVQKYDPSFSNIQSSSDMKDGYV